METIRGTGVKLLLDGSRTPPQRRDFDGDPRVLAKRHFPVTVEATRRTDADSLRGSRVAAAKSVAYVATTLAWSK
jgi:hypothetical protein